MNEYYRHYSFIQHSFTKKEQRMVLTMEKTGSYLLELSSNAKNIRKIEPYVDEIMRSYCLTEGVYGNILISITEAVTNAIIHGNKEDENKKVIVCVKNIDDSNITFLISDEGPGFDPDQLPDPTATENLLKLGGRGVFLMRQLSDGVIFADEGRTVEILFKL